MLLVGKLASYSDDIFQATCRFCDTHMYKVVMITAGTVVTREVLKHSRHEAFCHEAFSFYPSYFCCMDSVFFLAGLVSRSGPAAAICYHCFL